MENAILGTIGEPHKMHIELSGSMNLRREEIKINRKTYCLFDCKEKWMEMENFKEEFFFPDIFTRKINVNVLYH